MGYYSGMALDPEEAARRVRAARHLAGLEQAELGRLMKKDGFGATDVGRLERPQDARKPPPPLSQGRITSLARHTGVPEAWFTEPDLKRLFGLNSFDLDELPDELKRRFEIAMEASKRQDNELRELRERVAALQGLTDDPASALERDEEAELHRRRADSTEPPNEAPTPEAETP